MATLNKDKLILAADHGGYELKEKIKRYLMDNDVKVEDTSPKLDENDDYPDIAIPAAEKVLAEKALGIFFCGTGTGMCISANKVKGIRAAVPFSEKTSRLARQHNNANIICLGGRELSDRDAVEIVRAFLTSSFMEGRHQRRVDKIMSYEKRMQ